MVKSFMAEGRRYRVGQVIIVPQNALYREWVVEGPMKRNYDTTNLVMAYAKDCPSMPNVFHRKDIAE